MTSCRILILHTRRTIARLHRCADRIERDLAALPPRRP